MKPIFCLLFFLYGAYGAPQLPPPAVLGYPDVVPVYEYQYSVADNLSGSNFGASETRNGELTRGEYHVGLSDGRVQTVTYVSQGDSGFVANVKYSGEIVSTAPVLPGPPLPPVGRNQPQNISPGPGRVLKGASKLRGFSLPKRFASFIGQLFNHE